MKVYDISGQWKLAVDAKKTGTRPELTDVMQLPGTVQEQKKVPANEDRHTGFLTDHYSYEGHVWVERKVSLPEYREGDVYTLTLERARKSTVWVDGQLAGTANSLCTSQRFDLTALAKPEMTITMLLDNTDYPTRGGHMTSPDTQTNWLGVVGELSITQEAKARVRELEVVADAAQRELRISFVLLGLGEGETCKAAASACGETVSFEAKAGQNTITLALPMVALWDEWTPVLYEVGLALENGNRYTRPFGLRSILPACHEDGSYCLQINGRDILLRGKHDGMIFPKTGYAPMEVDGWYQVMKMARDYGINHYRFHTCCPPEAAFVAADQLGIYMEPELPFWGTIAAKGEEGYQEEEQEYLIAEGFRILAEYSHHPSFMMLSLGNELWGSRERLGEIIAGFKKRYPHVLYTSGSNNFQFYPAEIPEEDVFVGVRLNADGLIRGSYAMCDAPQGFLQTEEPATVHCYDMFFADGAQGVVGDENGEIEIQYGTGVKKVKTAAASGRYLPKKPVVTHEVGQYFTYPDFREIDRRDGVLQAENFDVFRERLAAAGLSEYAAQYTACSGALAAACYKLEIEAARRSRHIAGYQLLDLQDFSGQGTATVGVLNAWMEPKGIISREDWVAFNGDTAVLAGVGRFVQTTGSELTVGVQVSHYGSSALKGAAIVVALGESSVTVACDYVAIGLNDYGAVTLPTGQTEGKKELTLTLTDAEGRTVATNRYDMFVYADACGQKALEVLGALAQGKDCVVNDVLFTASMEQAKAYPGKSVVVAPAAEGIEGTYCADFWNYPMFRSISASMGRKEPVGTLGLLIDTDHPALAGFYSEAYSTPQWYQLVMGGNAAILDGTGVRPIVRVMDNVERNHNLGLLYEDGGALVCTVEAARLLEYPETRRFFEGLYNYRVKES